MKKAALYIRTSTELQDKGMDSQRRALEIHCQQKGIADYIFFEDFGVSGARQNRPSLDKLIHAVRAGEIDTVIVYSFSRFARSTKHLILALEEFQKFGVAFISITENIDTSTALGRTIFQIIASISELERELIRERVINGLKAAKARGTQLGAAKKFDNPDIFLQLRVKGLTIRQIAKTIKCSTTTVTRMLKHKPLSLSQNLCVT